MSDIDVCAGGVCCSSAVVYILNSNKIHNRNLTTMAEGDNKSANMLVSIDQKIVNVGRVSGFKLVCPFGVCV